MDIFVWAHHAWCLWEADVYEGVDVYEGADVYDGVMSMRGWCLWELMSMPGLMFRADHEDQEVVLFNRQMLPAYYGLLRLTCQASRSFTRDMAMHQNIQWAFKNITLYMAQYSLVNLKLTHSKGFNEPPFLAHHSMMLRSCDCWFNAACVVVGHTTTVSTCSCAC